MVAHGKAVKKTQVVEWSESYIQYKQVIKKLSSCVSVVHEKIREIGDSKNIQPFDASPKTRELGGEGVNQALDNDTRICLHDMPQHREFIDFLIQETTKAQGEWRIDSLTS